MKREDFIFIIGYQGSVAIIDGKARKQYGSYTTRQLAEAGLFKPAFCSALYSGDPKEMEEFLSIFNAAHPGPAYTQEQLSRLFGVFEVPKESIRYKIL
ncbi:MAG: hypothetical protein Kow009_16110 [Spirochaetales bacterium]